MPTHYNPHIIISFQWAIVSFNSQLVSYYPHIYHLLFSYLPIYPHIIACLAVEGIDRYDTTLTNVICSGDDDTSFTLTVDKAIEGRGTRLTILGLEMIAGAGTGFATRIGAGTTACVGLKTAGAAREWRRDSNSVNIIGFANKCRSWNRFETWIGWGMMA